MGTRVLAAAVLVLVVVLLWVRLQDEGGRGRAAELPPQGAGPGDGGARGAGLAAPPIAAEEEGERESAYESAPPGAVLVLVHDPRGKPIAAARVRSRTASGAHELRTDASGRCVIPGPREVDLEVEVSAEGFAGRRGRAPAGERLEVELERAVRVRGTVVDALSRLPVAGARVHQQRFMDWTFVVEDVVADEQGSFELEGAPEEKLALCASAAGYPEQGGEAMRETRREKRVARSRSRSTPKWGSSAWYSTPRAVGRSTEPW